MDFSELNLDIPKPPPPVKREAQLVIEDMVTEIAYHEASHFVIGILVLNLDLSFMPYSSIEINVSEENVSGVCNGMTPTISPQDDPYTPNVAAPFFKEDKNRIFGKLFSVIAGYESYKKFLQDDDCFIGHTDLINDKDKMWYYSLKYILKQATIKINFSLIKDYCLVDKILNYGGYESYEKKMEIVIRIQNDLKELMSNQSVVDSIQYVKNALIEKNGSVIKERELEVITEKVKRNTNSISILNYLNKYEVFKN